MSFNSNRPQIKIPINNVAKILTLLALFVLIVHIIYITYHYNSLPQTIATHFNASGNADGYGSKNSLFLLVGIATIIFLLLTILAKYPHLHNFPVNITEANASYHYGNSVKMLRILNVIVQILFFYISYGSIQVALKNATTLNSVIIFSIVGLLLICTFYFLYKTFTYKEKP